MDHTSRSNAAHAHATGMVDVLVPVALDQTYSYKVPRGMELKAGDLVGVPLGPREVLAVVWGENANPDPRLHNRLKEVSSQLATTQNRISTGQRVATASDNAAYWSIATSMRADNAALS
ncbi:MAG: hypothetical protein JSV48_21555, partial [Bradyrhizobium sp.]